MRVSKKISLQQSVTVQSPGRINIIGEHTDYNDGFVLPAAIDKTTTVKIERREGSQQVHLKALNIDKSFTFDLLDFSPLSGGWENYLMGVVHEFQKLGVQFSGFDVEFEGNVPIGGGMSSSASLECSFAFALNQIFDLGFETAKLIEVAQLAEHNFVGIKCGIMDQFASMMGKKDHVILLDCRTLEYRYYPLALGTYQLLLLNTNVSHTLASSEYNTRRAECEEGSEILKSYFPAIINLRDISYQELQDQQDKLPETIFKRCRHVVSENDRVLAATNALENGNHKKLGKLMYDSHFSLQKDYEVSCEELDFLVNATLDKDYILGSRMMGGGFGGCTINILKKDRIEEFVDDISKTYRNQFNIELTPYKVSIENGTNQL